MLGRGLPLVQGCHRLGRTAAATSSPTHNPTLTPSLTLTALLEDATDAVVQRWRRHQEQKGQMDPLLHCKGMLSATACCQRVLPKGKLATKVGYFGVKPAKMARGQIGTINLLKSVASRQLC